MWIQIPIQIVDSNVEEKYQDLGMDTPKDEYLDSFVIINSNHILSIRDFIPNGQTKIKGTLISTSTEDYTVRGYFVDYFKKLLNIDKNLTILDKNDYSR